MNKEYILKSAKLLKKASKTACDEFSLKSDKLISEMNSEMLKRPEVEELVGKNNIDMMQDNHANHIRFISSILKNYDEEVLVETILWVFRAYRSHGFSTNYWAVQLNTWIKILKNQLSDETFLEVQPLYEWMQINIPVFVAISDKKLESPNN